MHALLYTPKYFEFKKETARDPSAKTNERRILLLTDTSYIANLIRTFGSLFTCMLL